MACALPSRRPIRLTIPPAVSSAMLDVQTDEDRGHLLKDAMEATRNGKEIVFKLMIGPNSPAAGRPEKELRLKPWGSIKAEPDASFRSYF
jgi:hypothetical protein